MQPTRDKREDDSSKQVVAGTEHRSEPDAYTPHAAALQHSLVAYASQLLSSIAEGVVVAQVVPAAAAAAGCHNPQVQQSAAAELTHI
jgi:hypothetical protein